MTAFRGAITLLFAAFSGVAPTFATAETSYRLLEFRELDGWELDTHQDALDAFLNTCTDLDADTWGPLCALAQQGPEAKAYFELFFRPVIVNEHERTLFTGYFEPELNGSRIKTSRYRYPIYRKPPEARGIWKTRKQIEEDGLLDGRGLEIAWVDNPVDALFLHVQGSGRIRLPDGSMIRVGYSGNNGRRYRSVGQELVRRGIYQSSQVSAAVIRNWVIRNPEAGRELLQTNPSYVFFREVRGVPPEAGPLGAMNRSISTLRTVAVDPEFTPLGAPVWIEKKGARPLRRLMIAQDTGSAIKGAQRADLFYGTGDKAGRDAGRIRDTGRMIVLLPIDLAYALAPEG